MKELTAGQYLLSVEHFRGGTSLPRSMIGVKCITGNPLTSRRVLLGYDFHRPHYENHWAERLPEAFLFPQECSASSNTNPKCNKFFVLVYLCIPLLVYFKVIHLWVPFSLFCAFNSFTNANVSESLSFLTLQVEL